MFYTIYDKGYTTWEETWFPVRTFFGKIGLLIRIWRDGFRIRVNITDRGVANKGNFVYPHYYFAPDDPVFSACSGIVRLGKKDGHTVLWCPKCLSVVQEQEVQGDEAFLKNLGISST